jgi:hypothetical protein
MKNVATASSVAVRDQVTVLFRSLPQRKETCNEKQDTCMNVSTVRFLQGEALAS